MATMGLQQVGLLILLASGVVTLDCDEIVQHQKGELRKTKELLEAMSGGPASPPECPITGMPDFGSPIRSTSRPSKEDARMAIGLIFKKTLHVFQLNFTQANWNTTVTDLFQVELHQQSQWWERCSVAHTGREARLQDPRVKLNLMIYFRKLQTFLRDKQYSLCAWEAVRKTISVNNLILLDQLLKSLSD
ncbi:interferon alpha-21-like [Podarcis lilfordi]|uniref:Interferon alpha-21-like n=1 Tax=Podarcis lilfordi TaxID=74358 RepID=A0AA35LI20_9SAUR|nr:interferon alpha-21-like [Podarcis lilfordi]